MDVSIYRERQRERERERETARERERERVLVSYREHRTMILVIIEGLQ